MMVLRAFFVVLGLTICSFHSHIGAEAESVLVGGGKSRKGLGLAFGIARQSIGGLVNDTYDYQAGLITTESVSESSLFIRAGAKKGKGKGNEMSLKGVINRLYEWLSQFLPESLIGKKGKGQRYGSSSSSKSSSSSSKSSSSSNNSSSSSSSSDSDKASTAMTHLNQQFKAGDPNNRIQKELQAFLRDPPDNLKLSVGKNIRSWIVTMTGVDGTVYAGEKFKLKIVFPKDYPAKPVSAYFLKPTPKHMHVYSNGDICCSLLGTDWRPTMTAQLISVSILSMLCSAKEKSMPQDNAMHADQTPGMAQDKWMYHDDKC